MGRNMFVAATMWLPIFVLCADLLTTGSAHAAQYSVDGFVLGERISPTNPNYQSYTCKQSDDFDEAIRCERTQVKSGRAGNITVSSTLIHAQDGTAIYIMTNAFPVSLSKAVVQNEITRSRPRSTKSRQRSSGCRRTRQPPLRLLSHGGRFSWMKLTTTRLLTIRRTKAHIWES